MQNFEAVIFDMDGLLLDSERIALREFLATFRELSLEPDESLFYPLIGTNAELGQQILMQGLAGKIDDTIFTDVWNRRLVESLIDQPVPLKSGVVKICAQLKELGLPKAIATSTNTQRAKNKLEKVGILKEFEFVLGGDQVQHSKPHPEMYLTAARRLGVMPEDCLALEDSENGVRSAVAAGMTVVQVPDLVKPSESLKALGHIIVENLGEVLPYFSLRDTQARPLNEGVS